jgi:hypothetical protein
MRLKNSKGITAAELTVALNISVLLFASILGAFIASRQFYESNMIGQALQRDANIITTRIIHGGKEDAGMVRLSDAVSFNQTSLSELHFFSKDDAVERWYRLSDDNLSIIYHHPVAGGAIQDEVIYTAPPGASISLRFETITNNVTFGIKVAVLRNFFGRTITGSAYTTVNIRNHA